MFGENRLRLQLPYNEIEAYCRENGIRRFALFGSVLRADFRPESDVDVLVEFAEDVKLGFEFIRIQDELSNLLGRNVDLNTDGSLGKYIKDGVNAEALTLYDAA